MHDRRKHCVRNTISVSVPVRKMFSLCQRSRASSPKPPERQNFPLPLNLRLDFTTCVMARGWTGCWAFGKLRPAEVFEHHYHPPPETTAYIPPRFTKAKMDGTRARTHMVSPFTHPACLQPANTARKPSRTPSLNGLCSRTRSEIERLHALKKDVKGGTLSHRLPMSLGLAA